MVWFDVYVAEFEFECSSFSLVFDIFLLENFVFFVFLFCFGLNLYSNLVLG